MLQSRQKIPHSNVMLVVKLRLKNYAAAGN